MLRSLLLALTALALVAPAAQACPEQDLSRPFSPWLDYAWYHPAPEDEWSLEGAAVVPGGQPWGGGAEALSIPARASAVTDAVCVKLDKPSVRFFARGTGVLAVSVIAYGGALELPVGAVVGTGAWAPSPVMLVVFNLLGEQDVRFRFTSVLGSFRIDDVWIDPYSKG